jgi:hypothetical protein
LLAVFTTSRACPSKSESGFSRPSSVVAVKSWTVLTAVSKSRQPLVGPRVFRQTAQAGFAIRNIQVFEYGFLVTQPDGLLLSRSWDNGIPDKVA